RWRGPAVAASGLHSRPSGRLAVMSVTSIVVLPVFGPVVGGRTRRGYGPCGRHRRGPWWHVRFQLGCEPLDVAGGDARDGDDVALPVATGQAPPGGDVGGRGVQDDGHGVGVAPGRPSDAL